MVRIRAATPEDEPFLRAMLHEAAFWDSSETRPPINQALADPRLARYTEGWLRAGDAGVIAVDEGARPVGAAWYRLFSAEAPGYGYIGPTTPEVGIAVAAEHRGKGIGGLLLGALLRTAREAGMASLSLSVAQGNHAVHLYEKHGFQKLAVQGGSWTMRVDVGI
jgi:GNAT superfamily N-acetyltransferase